MNPPPIVELRTASYQADGARILNEASWVVRPGEHWAVLGPNGAGKTTLLKIACGYLWPNAGGEVLREGELLVDLRALRRSIGWVTSTLSSQIPYNEPALQTVVSGKFAQTGLKPTAWDRPSEADFARARLLLERLHGADLAAKPFGVLSQGEQQKALIARAMMPEPVLVILDEPCAGLDAGARERFLAALQNLATSQVEASLVMVTHHLEEIMPAFTKTLVMQSGRILRSGPTQEIIDEQLLATLYGLEDVDLIRRNGRLWPVW